VRSAVNSGVGAYTTYTYTTQTKKRTPVKHRKHETHLKRCTDKLCQGRYPSSLDFLFVVCYCTDNLTQALDDADINDDEDTEDYDVDEYLQGSAPSLSDNAPQPNLNTDNLCDICWSAERARIIFLPCGHSRFCQTCADTCFGSVDRKCALCRTQIDLIIPIY